MMRIGFIILLVLWTTARHEASHAVTALLDGAEIQEMRLLPGIHPDLGFYFGYVKHSGDTTWLTDAADLFLQPPAEPVHIFLVTAIGLTVMAPERRATSSLPAGPMSEESR